MKKSLKYSLKRIATYLLILSMIFPSALIYTTAKQAIAAGSAATSNDETTTPKVKLNKKKLNIYKGKTKKLILKNAIGKVKWKSQNKTIAKVNSKGKVTAKKKGKTTITAVYNGKKYKCKVTVYEKKSSSSNTSGSSGNGSSGKHSGSGSGSGGESNSHKSSTVYWTPSGEVYHSTRNCPTLSRSRIIYSGSISESGKSRGCKVCF